MSDGLPHSRAREWQVEHGIFRTSLLHLTFVIELDTHIHTHSDRKLNMSADIFQSGVSGKKVGELG